MFDDLKVYFYENVLDTYQKYLRIRRSAKLGKSNDLKAVLNISSILYHLREHLPVSRRKSYNDLVALCPDYEIIRDIVNLSKHKTITRYVPRISNPDNIKEMLIFSAYKDKNGEYWHTTKSVFAKLDDGSEKDLFEVITNVMNMWLKEFEEMGIITHVEPFPFHVKKIPFRSQCGKMDITLINKLRVRLNGIFQRYNYETGSYDPVDMSGKQLNFNIHKNECTIELKITDKQNGEEKTIDIKVDDSQLTKLRQLKSTEKKVELFLQLAKEQGKITDYHKTEKKK